MAGTLFDTEIENENMLEIELDQNENKNEKLPIELSQELETELLDSLLHEENNNDLLDVDTDGPIDFMRQVLATVLSVKADSIEKNNQSCKINRFKSSKNMVRTKLVPKRTRIRH